MSLAPPRSESAGARAEGRRACARAYRQMSVGSLLELSANTCSTRPLLRKAERDESTASLNRRATAPSATSSRSAGTTGASASAGGNAGSTVTNNEMVGRMLAALARARRGFASAAGCCAARRRAPPPPRASAASVCVSPSRACASIIVGTSRANTPSTRPSATMVASGMASVPR
jgi:hypothetical protein